MNTRAHTRALTALAALTLGATLAAVTPAYAADPQAPVTVGDTVTLWPGQIGQINVLDNDTDPDGDELALCRFPEPDFTSGEVPSVLVLEDPSDAGSLVVLTDADATGTYTIDYYVCDFDFLVPATLTVVVRDVAPVHVSKIPGKPGKLEVTNDNEAPIKFWFGDARAPRPDGKVAVPAHGTVIVKVQRTRIFWIGVIGRGGIADYGWVNHIKLNGDPLPHDGMLLPGTPRPASPVQRWLG